MSIYTSLTYTDVNQDLQPSTSISNQSVIQVPITNAGNTDDNFISDETISRLRKVRVKQVKKVDENAHYNMRQREVRDENYTSLTAAVFYKDLNAKVRIYFITALLQLRV